MTISFTACGQSHFRGNWRTPSELGPAYPGGFAFGGTSNYPTVPNANDPATQGIPMFARIAELLYLRHGTKAHFWNAAVGATSLASSWNGTQIVTTTDHGGPWTISGSTITAPAGMDEAADGDLIRLRNCGANDGTYTVSGTPSSTVLTITGTFPEAGSYTNCAFRIGNPPVVGGAGWDPNAYYANAHDNGFALGRFDARYVMSGWMNNDFSRRQSLSDVKTQMDRFVDYWQAKGADGILLGGAIVGTSLTETVYTNGMMFARDVWLAAAEQVVAENDDVYLGAHFADLVGYNATGRYKADGVHMNFDSYHLWTEQWYRAIAAMLGYTLSTVGEFDLTYPRAKIA